MPFLVYHTEAMQTLFEDVPMCHLTHLFSFAPDWPPSGLATMSSGAQMSPAASLHCESDSFYSAILDIVCSVPYSFFLGVLSDLGIVLPLITPCLSVPIPCMCV